MTTKLSDLEEAQMLLSEERIARDAAERTLRVVAEEMDRVAVDRDRQAKRVLYLEGLLQALYGEAKAVVGTVERINRIEPFLDDSHGASEIGLPDVVEVLVVTPTRSDLSGRCLVRSDDAASLQCVKLAGHGSGHLYSGVSRVP